MSQDPTDQHPDGPDTAPTTRLPGYEPPAGSAAEGTAGPTGSTAGTTTVTQAVPPAVTQAVVQDDVAPPVRRQMRMRTLVVGIVLLAIAVLTNLNLTTSIDFRLGTVVLALMIGCGVLLIVGASRRE